MTMPTIEPRRSAPRSAGQAFHWNANRDPLGFHAGDTNLYRYVGNGPTNATDPSGLEIFFDWGHKSNDGISAARRKEIENAIRKDFEEMKALGGVIGHAANIACASHKAEEWVDINFRFMKGASAFANYPSGTGHPKDPKGRHAIWLDPYRFDNDFLPEGFSEAEAPYPTADYPNAARWIIYLHEIGHYYDPLSLTDPTPNNPLGMNLVFENVCRDQLEMKPRRSYDGFNPQFWEMPEGPPVAPFTPLGLGRPLTPAETEAIRELGRIRGFIKRSE